MDPWLTVFIANETFSFRTLFPETVSKRLSAIMSQRNFDHRYYSYLNLRDGFQILMPVTVSIEVRFIVSYIREFLFSLVVVDIART